MAEGNKVLSVNGALICGTNNSIHYETGLEVSGAIYIHNPETGYWVSLMAINNGIFLQDSKGQQGGIETHPVSKTITHKTNIIGETQLPGTFCETTGKIYNGYEKITNTDCICQVQTATTLNKKIVGIITAEDTFASHGDVLVRVNSLEGLEIGDILAPDSNGFARKAGESELMYFMMHSIPMPKITCLETGIEGMVATFIK